MNLLFPGDPSLFRGGVRPRGGPGVAAWGLATGFGRVAGLLVLAGVGVGGCGGSGGGGDGGPLAVTGMFGEVGLNPGQFTYPRCLDVEAAAGDGAGGVWVIDKSARVQRVDAETGRITAGWTMPEWAMGKPCGITVGPDGLVYIADTHYFRVVAFRVGGGEAEGTGEPVLSWGEYGEGPGQFVYTTDIAILPAGDGSVERIYVSEYGGNDRVSVFDREHRFLFSFGRFGDGDQADPVEFNRPQSIAVDARRGEVIVADSCNHRVGVFTLEGKLIRWVGGEGKLAYPYGLAIREDGTAMVAEFGGHRVRHLDLQTGELLGVYGRPGRGPGELTNPWGVAVKDGTVYVLDSGNARVQMFKAPPLMKRRAAGGAGERDGGEAGGGA